MGWITGVIEYADIVAGILGLLGSLLLAWPQLMGLDDRRRMEQVLQVDDEGAATKGAREWLINRQATGYKETRRFTLWGLRLLILCFVLLIVAAVHRHATAP